MCRAVIFQVGINLPNLRGIRATVLAWKNNHRIAVRSMQVALMGLLLAIGTLDR